MNQQTTGLAVRKSITVEAPQERAFEVFTHQMGSWWPFASKSIAAVEAETAVVEPQAGGRWYERGIDGSECQWGTVLAYEPPERIVLNWEIGAQWTHDPTVNTEVEVRFIAESETRTRVELEHRGLEAYGDQAEQMHAIFASSEGWGEILDRYAAGANPSPQTGASA